MLTIKVLGPGCANCNRLQALAEQALEELLTERPDLETTVQKVTDTDEFLRYGVLTTPGLVINDRLVSQGRLPGPKVILEWLREVLPE